MARTKLPSIPQKSQSPSPTHSAASKSGTPELTPPSPKNSPSPSPPPKPKTKKRTPAKKPHPKPQVSKKDQPPQKKSKGVVFKEPIITRSQSKEVQGKGKKKGSEQPQSSSSSDDTLGRQLREAIEKSKLDKIVGKIASQAGVSSSHQVKHPSASASGAPSASQAPVDDQLTSPPEGFNVTELKALPQKVYDDEFKHRHFCPVVYVDLDYLKKNCHLDLYPYLQYYAPWLNIHLPYSPTVVKTFYCNMKTHNIKSRSGDLIEEAVSTTIRGKFIMISAKIINDLLGYVAPPNDPPSFSANETFKILRPKDPIGPLTFKPIDMPDNHRILHYIYSRSIVNKSKNFTHFAQKDYYLLASLVAGQQRNVGEIIFSEMRRFRFSSTKSTTIPYPQLVSFILMKNKIWYLEGKERTLISRFGKTQLTHMGINLPVSRTKATSKREATPSRGDEAQSSAQGPIPPPSFLNASLSNHMSEVINQAVSSLKKELVTEYEKLVEKMEAQVIKLVDKANTNFELMFKTQDEMSQRITNMETFLHSHFPSSSSGVPPETTHTSPLHPQTHVLFTDPESNVDVTFDRSPSIPPSSSIPQPPSPSDQPIDPLSGMISFVPPPDIPSDVDKTGEKDV